MYMNMLIMHK